MATAEEGGVSGEMKKEEAKERLVHQQHRL